MKNSGHDHTNPSRLKVTYPFCKGNNYVIHTHPSEDTSQ